MKQNNSARKMTPGEHQIRHTILHRNLDELVADFINITGRLPSQTTVMELMEWSHKQTIHPEEKDR